MIYLLCGLILIFIILLVCILYMLKTNQNKNDDYAKQQAYQSQLLQLETIEKRLQSNMAEQNHKTNLLIHSMMERFGKLDQSQSQLMEVSKELVSLQNLLSDKKTRGTFGEVQLKAALSNLFEDNQHIYKLQYRLSNGSIVDCAIMGMQNNKVLSVDSKFPLENFNRIFDEELSKNEQMLYQRAFKKDVIKHIDDIHYKYILEEETTPIAFMFVPAESIVSYLYNQMDDIIQYSYKKGVFIVSLTTLMAYIQVVQSLYIDHKRSLKMNEIQEEYMRLATEFLRFKERYTLILKDFDKLSQDIRNTDITMNKLVTRFERIQEVKLDENE